MTDEGPTEREQAMRAVELEFSELIAQVRRIIMRNADRVSPGMLPGAYKVFTTIADAGPLTASAIADRLMIDKGQLSRTVRELEDLGLVARTPDPSDGRAHLLEPTEDGRRRLATARAPQEHGLSRALEKWDVSDVRRLADLLHALTHEQVPGAD
ncbi:MarR family winged helix-turn-helix transcriptional regulator [Microbacterium marinilacus]|uniref:MarR family transcriptional regulator n=1 Tax=Microbacterium marinilacus TaxID=415209 RepID=A0ABP7BBB0_9MICO|nr:MarR family transcriptional regulator [Microbacterium marinilacus]